MYDHELFLGLYPYDICFVGGIFVCLMMFNAYTKKKGMSYKVQNFYLYVSFAAIFGGLGSAFLFQAVYNWIANGVFEFGGITFLGGLIGGALIFLLGYKLFAKEEERAVFMDIVVEAAPPCILIAHAIGRIGCFFGGCCHGIETTSWLGVQFPGDAHKVYPTQLFESAFLFMLCGVTSFLYMKKNIKHNMEIYLISYGIFRFLLEFIRGDDSRGAFVPGLTPSQFQSILLVLVGCALLAWKLWRNKKGQENGRLLENKGDKVSGGITNIYIDNRVENKIENLNMAPQEDPPVSCQFCGGKNKGGATVCEHCSGRLTV